ncbi:alpha/beta fold hydrolase [Cellulosimicrobium cellulans]|uniref:Alpha/beta hydrolase n=1 Tax=Cellulosimicrobium funkei TaxID=264251 RepID=A0A0H2KQG4_9MICO|nr:alpha/beta hydrolase [Cellulosimicrobium funkei]KLN35791.1 alpha/beta hydrolase [Cellulosimicrobium funkei]
MIATTALGPVSTVDAGPLTVGYVEAGDPAGPPVVLLHGYPYDVHSYVDVVPSLAAEGLRVVVPYLRGHGPTTFREPGAVRSGQQAALGADLVALLDALGIGSAVLAGYDWGGRAACVVAALWPERVRGLVSVNGYLVQDVAAAQTPIRPDLEAGFWYFWYFATERGRRGLTQNRAEIARVLWTRNSPERSFTEAELARTAEAFDNPGYVDVVIHSYRHRLGLAPGDPAYEDLERRLAALPRIGVPTITLDGLADGNFPATDGSATARFFAGPREHRQVPHAGHDLPAEAPEAFAGAVLDLVRRPAEVRQPASGS